MRNVQPENFELKLVDKARVRNHCVKKRKIESDLARKSSSLKDIFTFVLPNNFEYLLPKHCISLDIIEYLHEHHNIKLTITIEFDKVKNGPISFVLHVID